MVETTEKYWDCDCENNYIHPKSKERCSICGADRENSPDSMACEVDSYINQIILKNDEILKLREKVKAANSKLNWQPISELKSKLKDGDLYGFFAYCPSEKEAVWIVHATIDEEGIIGYFGVGKEEYYYLDHKDCFSHFAILELNKPCE